MNITPENLKIAEGIFSSISECIKGTSLEHLLYKEIENGEVKANTLADIEGNSVEAPDFSDEFKMH